MCIFWSSCAVDSIPIAWAHVKFIVFFRIFTRQYEVNKVNGFITVYMRVHSGIKKISNSLPSRTRLEVPSLDLRRIYRVNPIYSAEEK